MCGFVCAVHVQLAGLLKSSTKTRVVAGFWWFVEGMIMMICTHMEMALSAELLEPLAFPIKKDNLFGEFSRFPLVFPTPLPLKRIEYIHHHNHHIM